MTNNQQTSVFVEILLDISDILSYVYCMINMIIGTYL